MIGFADAIDADVLRIRHQFLDMPGLELTTGQTARFYDLSRAHAQRLLDLLVAEGFLIRSVDGIYRRASLLSSD